MAAVAQLVRAGYKLMIEGLAVQIPALTVYSSEVSLGKTLHPELLPMGLVATGMVVATH